MDYETWTTCEGVAVLHRYHGGCHEVLRDGKRIGSGRSRDEAMTAARWALASDDARAAMKERLTSRRVRA